MENGIEMMDPKVIEKFGSHLKYVLMECSQCGRTWGVNVFDNQLRKDQLICQTCAIKKIESSL